MGVQVSASSLVSSDLGRWKTEKLLPKLLPPPVGILSCLHSGSPTFTTRQAEEVSDPAAQASLAESQTTEEPGKRWHWGSDEEQEVECELLPEMGHGLTQVAVSCASFLGQGFLVASGKVHLGTEAEVQLGS